MNACFIFKNTKNKNKKMQDNNDVYKECDDIIDNHYIINNVTHNDPITQQKL